MALEMAAKPYEYKMASSLPVNLASFSSSSRWTSEGEGEREGERERERERERGKGYIEGWGMTPLPCCQMVQSLW